MTATRFGTSDPRTQSKWAKDVFLYALKDIKLYSLMGKGTDVAIVVNKDLTTKAGDNVVFEMVAPFTGNGFGQNETADTDEESLSVLNMSVKVNARGKSASIKDFISMKRTDIDVRTTFRDNLAKWFSQAIETDLVQALSGVYNVATNVETVNVHAPSTNRILYCGEKIDGSGFTTYATDALLSAATAANALFGINCIHVAKRKAMLGTPKIRPIRIKGKDYYVMLIHPYQEAALKAQTSANAWAAITKEAQVRGDENPLFSGALGIIDGVVLISYDRILTRTGAGGTTPAEGFLLNAGLTATTDAVATGKTVARALFLGAESGAVCFGMEPKWTEDMIDRNRMPCVTVDAIYGVSKTIFSTYTIGGSNVAGEDYGCIAVDTLVVVD